MDAIDRIEVIRGPGSALYGANAFLGVVNIITREPDSFDGTTFRYQGHRFNGNLGRVYPPRQVIIWDRWISFSLTSKTRLTAVA